jgi:amidase
MVPFALGTQTQGSVLRPAAFCGITGFKPSYGTVPLEGVLPLAPSFDTLGFFTHTAEDVLALWEVLDYDKHHGARPANDDFTLGVPDPLPDVEPSMAAALRQTVAGLRDAGAPIQPVDLLTMLTELHAVSRVVMAYEAAIVHRERYAEHGAKLAHIADLVEEGRSISRSHYEDALGSIAAWRDRATEIYRTTPVLLVPAAVGPAPFSLASTGDPRINSPWTALGTPAITIPMGDADGLPLGLQLTANRGNDARLLQVAVHVEALLQRT